MAARPRLKKGDISIAEVLTLSKFVYKGNIDNKKSRSKEDVSSAKIIMRNNFVYDRSTGLWKQNGREAKLVFQVNTAPTSYKRTDTLKVHRYPVFFLIRDINAGLNSAFKWRTGSYTKRMKLVPAGLTPKARKKIIHYNIRNGIQLQFIFDLMHVLDLYGLLFGPNFTNRNPPQKTNPKLTPFFDKHAYFCVTKILPKILETKKGAALGTKTDGKTP